MESEFVAMTEAAKNLVLGNRIWQECQKFKLIPKGGGDAVLRVDNQAAIDFARSPIKNYKSKHIDVRLFFIWDQVYKGIF